MSLTLKDAARVGGSDLSGILNRSPWATPLSIYARIVGALEGRMPPDNGNAATRRGNHLEAAILALYAEETGAKVLPGPKWTHPSMPFVRASLDGLAERDGVIVVDAKTVGADGRHYFGEPGTDQVREDILFQQTLYIGIGLKLGVVTRPAADVPVLGLNGADVTVFTVGFDAELFRMLEEAVARFWADHVLPRRPPPPSEPFADLAAVGHLHRSHSGEALHWDALAPEGQVAIAEYLRAKGEEAKAAEIRASWELRSKLAMGVAPQLVGLPEYLGASRIDWKQNKPSTVTDWEAIAKVGAAYVGPIGCKRLLKQHTTTKEGARPFVARGRKKE